jgi:hypothetical protein
LIKRKEVNNRNSQQLDVNANNLRKEDVMKKWLVVLLVLVFGAFSAGTAVAAQYDVEVTKGYIGVSETGVLTDGSTTLPGGDPLPPGTPVLGLDSTAPPGVSSSAPESILTPPAGTWNAGGWWEFEVVASTTGDPWNTVFAGGDWWWKMAWEGVLSTQAGDVTMDPAIFDTFTRETFDDVYGRWYENNPGVWTYFGLYVHPNTGEASTPGAPPVGVFAFLATEAWGNYDWVSLYSLPQDEPIPVIGGTGTITATPEPGTMLLLGAGLLGLAGFGRKKFLKK